MTNEEVSLKLEMNPHSLLATAVSHSVITRTNAPTLTKFKQIL